MNILLFVVSTAISIAAVFAHRFAVISMIDPDRVTAGNHNNDSILLLTVLITLSVVLSIKNKDSMRKRKLFEKYLNEDRLSSLPLLAHWKPNPPVERDVLKNARAWYLWKINSSWLNICNVGEPDISAWNFYITHLYELSDALELSFSELVTYSHASLCNKQIKPQAEALLEQAKDALNKESYWTARSRYKKYKRLIDAAQWFRLIDNVPVYETYDAFLESCISECVT